MNIVNKIRKISFIDRKYNFPLSSFPFVSGDSFKLISDIVYVNNKKQSINGLNNIIFSDLNSINLLETDISQYQNKTIIIHNGDDQPSDLFRWLADQYNCNLFSTNIIKKYKKETTLPIGIENYHFNNNGSFHYYNILNFNKNFIKKEIILFSFNINTNIKIRLRYKIIAEKYGINLQFPLQIDEYRRKLSSSHFIISPPGNGIDTHRFWEAIYHRTIPVIEREFYLFNDLKLPVLVVDNIIDFFNLSDNEKLKIYDEIIKLNSEAAYMNYWIRKIFY